jgi:hypothetical protein
MYGALDTGAASAATFAGGGGSGGGSGFSGGYKSMNEVDSMDIIQSPDMTTKIRSDADNRTIAAPQTINYSWG